MPSKRQKIKELVIDLMALAKEYGFAIEARPDKLEFYAPGWWYVGSVNLDGEVSIPRSNVRLTPKERGFMEYVGRYVKKKYPS